MDFFESFRCTPRLYRLHGWSRRMLRIQAGTRAAMVLIL